MTEAMQTEMLIRLFGGMGVGSAGLFGFLIALMKDQKRYVLVSCIVLMVASLVILPVPFTGLIVFAFGMLVVGLGFGNYRDPIRKSWLAVGASLIVIGFGLIFGFMPDHPVFLC